MTWTSPRSFRRSSSGSSGRASRTCASGSARSTSASSRRRPRSSSHILNDAWSDNWGFVPLTPPEIKDVGVKLKPIVFNDLIRIAELDGKPVAFMITLPDLNEAIRPLGGSLLPFGWAKLLLWLRRSQGSDTMRVPLMGVIKELQASRLASHSSPS